jgi:hypothetical protein
MRRDNSKDTTPYAVYCMAECEPGVPVFLTAEEYDRQLDMPYNKWTCPECNGPAMWDDDSQVTS